MVAPRNSQETLPHVDDGLFGGVGRGFVDDCPGYRIVSNGNIAIVGRVRVPDILLLPSYPCSRAESITPFLHRCGGRECCTERSC